MRAFPNPNVNESIPKRAAAEIRALGARRLKIVGHGLTPKARPQFVRVGGSIFLTLLDMRLLPAQFALPAGYGDILVGLTAPIVVWALNHHKPYGRQLALAWNALGMLNFAVALGTGIAFIGPYGRQSARTGHSIAYLDYVLMIPGFAVSILTLLHVVSIIKLVKTV